MNISNMSKIKLLLWHLVVALMYPRPLIGLFYLPRFFSHWFSYKQQALHQKIKLLDVQPCLCDWSTHTPFDPHYFYQGAWLARKLVYCKPEKHVDIGSSVLSMSTISAIVDTIFVDYRPLKAELPGLTSLAGDILDLPFDDNSVSSLSCLHVVEHIGLGRYGDPINPEGSKMAAAELQRIVAHGGDLFISLPVGRERICFNAHRIHSPLSVPKLFPAMELMSFSFVDDCGCYHASAGVKDAVNLEYGCGLFHFRKQ